MSDPRGPQSMKALAVGGSRVAEMELRTLTKVNFPDFESFEPLVKCENGGSCYCAFWHQRWSSADEWERKKKESPLENRDCLLAKVSSGFHVGVLAYIDNKVVAWISVGPLTDFYWTWPRIAQIGPEAKTTAGILCFSVARKSRGQGLQGRIISQLQTYAGKQGWTAVEGYPFDEEALSKNPLDFAWPGFPKPFSEAGFARIGPHWQSQKGEERSIYRWIPSKQNSSP